MNIIISYSSDEPIYSQIVNSIQRAVSSGELSEGDPMPSIRALARDLGISVITTKKAYEVLEKQGYIKTMQGKGSFVSTQSGALARERRQSEMEQLLMAAADISKELGLSAEALAELLKELYEEE